MRTRTKWLIGIGSLLAVLSLPVGAVVLGTGGGNNCGSMLGAEEGRLGARNYQPEGWWVSAMPPRFYCTGVIGSDSRYRGGTRVTLSEPLHELWVLYGLIALGIAWWVRRWRRHHSTTR